jgi:hypothetical protein
MGLKSTMKPGLQVKAGDQRRISLYERLSLSQSRSRSTEVGVEIQASGFVKCQGDKLCGSDNGR